MKIILILSILQLVASCSNFEYAARRKWKIVRIDEDDATDCYPNTGWSECGNTIWYFANYPHGTGWEELYFGQIEPVNTLCGYGSTYGFTVATNKCYIQESYHGSPWTEYYSMFISYGYPYISYTDDYYGSYFSSNCLWIFKDICSQIGNQLINKTINLKADNGNCNDDTCFQYCYVNNNLEFVKYNSQTDYYNSNKIVLKSLAPSGSGCNCKRLVFDANFSTCVSTLNDNGKIMTLNISDTSVKLNLKNGNSWCSYSSSLGNKEEMSEKVKLIIILCVVIPVILFSVFLIWLCKCRNKGERENNTVTIHV